MNRDELIFGLHAVSAAINCYPKRILELWVDSARQDMRMRRLVDMADKQHLAARQVDDRMLRKLVSGEPQGVVARYRAPELGTEESLSRIIKSATGSPLLLILDGITDPHNLGACLRTAEAAGADAVVIPADRSARVTPVVRKVACGAAERVPIVRVNNLARALRILKEAGVWLYGMADEAHDNLYDQNLTGWVGFVLGAEGTGLRRLTRDLCDYSVSLPMAGSGESLNVSVATGVCLYEAARQRRVVATTGIAQALPVK